MAALAPGPAVPDAYIGVWQRTLLRTPQREDTTTRVYWLQTRSWHADIRVPADRPPCPGMAALDALSRVEMMELARQQGFCGTTVVDGDICRWLRKYDFQPPSGANDIGRMQFETPDRVLEFGAEAEYFEIWERLPGSHGATFAIQESDDPLSLLLGAGEYVMAVRPRSAPLPLAPDLATFAAGKNGQVLREALDFEISFGRRNANHAWTIELSTLPWQQGRVMPLDGL
ncbi:MAG: hypothetical protein ABI648_05190 [Betaproteobacteria bacterium]|jgi:hypothetical protein